MTANLELRLKLRLSEVGRWAEAAADPLSMAKKAAREEKIQREKIEREKKKRIVSFESFTISRCQVSYSCFASVKEGKLAGVLDKLSALIAAAWIERCGRKRGESFDQEIVSFQTICFSLHK